MKNSDEAVEKVLGALRDAEAPTGMEQRILRMLDQQAPEQAKGPATRKWVLASACVLAGVLATSFALKHQPAKLLTTGLRPDPVSRKPELLSTQTASPSRSGRTPLASAATASAPVLQTTPAEPDPATLDAAYAPSLLAPPLPLTEQEQLLLRMTYLGEAVEIAMLTSAEWKNPADAEFDTFFAPPTPPAPADTTPAVPPSSPSEQTDQVKGETP